MFFWLKLRGRFGIPSIIIYLQRGFWRNPSKSPIRGLSKLLSGMTLGKRWQGKLTMDHYYSKLFLEFETSSSGKQNQTNTATENLCATDQWFKDYHFQSCSILCFGNPMISETNHCIPATAEGEFCHAGWQHSAGHRPHDLRHQLPLPPQCLKLRLPSRVHPQIEARNGGVPTTETQRQPRWKGTQRSQSEDGDLGNLSRNLAQLYNIPGCFMISRVLAARRQASCHVDPFGCEVDHIGHQAVILLAPHNLGSHRLTRVQTLAPFCSHQNSL